MIHFRFTTFIQNSTEFKDYVESFPEDDTKDLTGVNWVSLLNHERFFMFYGNVIEDHKTYYKYAELKKAKTIEEATFIFESRFENPKIKKQKERVEAAEEIFRRLCT